MGIVTGCGAGRSRPREGTHPPELLGWRCKDDGETCFVCAKCGGRIMARGCRLLGQVFPVWKDHASDAGNVCVCCGQR